MKIAAMQSKKIREKIDFVYKLSKIDAGNRKGTANTLKWMKMNIQPFG